MNMSNVALGEAVQIAGGQAALVRELNRVTGRPFKQAHVWNWLNRDKGIPPDVAPYIERITGVTRQALCPEFPWGDAA